MGISSTIFLPKKINVGFQERRDTYTGKLAYIIYYDEKGVLRKEKSWNSWRDQKIPNEEFDNVPTSGFVLNKKVGDHSYGWGHRKAYCRVYDPRNFEFEITIENLLYILENTNCIKGKGLEGEFVYGWDGTTLILIPTSSPDYTNLLSYSEKIKECKKLSAKDIKVGFEYIDKNNQTYIYMGRHNVYESRYQFVDPYTQKESETDSYIKIMELDRQFVNMDYSQLYVPNGKVHVFARRQPQYDTSYKKVIGHYYTFKVYRSIPKTLLECVSNECVSDYADMVEAFEENPEFYPPDLNSIKFVPYTLEEFKKIIDEHKGSIGKFHSEQVYSSSKMQYTIKINIKEQNLIIELDTSKGNDCLRTYSLGRTDFSDAVNDFHNRCNNICIENEQFSKNKVYIYLDHIR